MNRPKLAVLAVLLLFLGATAAGTYVVRGRLLRQAMASALSVGDERTAVWALRRRPAPTDVKADCDLPALHWAAANGFTGAAKALIARGVDVNAVWMDWVLPPYPSGTFIMPPSAQQNHARAIALLSGYGYRPEPVPGVALFDNGPCARLWPDPNVSSEGLTALDLAVYRGDEEMVKLLLDASACADGRVDASEFDRVTMVPLRLALIRGHLRIASLLIERGADINRRLGNFEESLPHLCVGARYLACADFLLSHRADPNVRNYVGATPLHDAAAFGYDDLAALLIDYGADVNAADEDGDSPLHRAAAVEKPGVAALLIAKGARVNAANKEGETPLHAAIHRGHKGFLGAVAPEGLPESEFPKGTRVLERLLAAGADVHAKDAGGDTPLHAAAGVGSEAAARILLDKGARVNETNALGRTPLHLAAIHGRIGTARFLIAKGADVSLADKQGHTPLFLATSDEYELKPDSGVISLDEDSEAADRRLHEHWPYPTSGFPSDREGTAELLRARGAKE